jgi:hypothetical protein
LKAYKGAQANHFKTRSKATTFALAPSHESSAITSIRNSYSPTEKRGLYIKKNELNDE